MYYAAPKINHRILSTQPEDYIVSATSLDEFVNTELEAGCTVEPRDLSMLKVLINRKHEHE